MGERYDAVVVGARCAGSTLATLLARAGWRVLLVDRDRFPSDSVSTHLMFPDTLDHLDRLGVMRRLQAVHHIPLVRFSWRVLGHAVAGGFTPVGGYDRAVCVRRIVLDAALVDAAQAAGAEVRFGRSVTGLMGDDPVTGVVLDTGEQIESRWVFGADGRASTVAKLLHQPAILERQGDMTYLMAYWRGLPASEWCHVDVRERAALTSVPCEDGIHLLSLATEAAHGPAEERYREGLHQFPAVLNTRLLEHAKRISPVIVVPENMMRGHHRTANGPGWALVGDSGLAKHPVSAQGIGDAVEQAWYVAKDLANGGDLTGYAKWRNDRAEEHYDFSFKLAEFGTDDRTAAHYSGLAGDPLAGQAFLDIFTKRRRPSEVTTRERTIRWNAAWAYQDGQRQVRALAEDLAEERLTETVPACPKWSIRDLLAHLAGLAVDTVMGTYFLGAAEAWRDPAVAAARERWTANQVSERIGRSLEQLLAEFDDRSRQLVTMLRRGSGPFFGGPAWMQSAPVADLAVHLADLYEALGEKADFTSPVMRIGFSSYRNWLWARIVERGLPPLRLSDGENHWLLGQGEPGATLTAGRGELFRAISGRTSAAQIRAHSWAGDPAPYLPIIAPYPLPGPSVPAAGR